MTISIPAEKLMKLEGMMQTYLTVPKISFTELSELLGFWEFCSCLLPKFMRAFAYSSHAFKARLYYLHKHKQVWMTKHMRKDLKTIKQLLPEMNNTVAMQPDHGKARADPACTDACGGKHAGAAWVTPYGFKYWLYSQFTFFLLAPYFSLERTVCVRKCMLSC